MNQKSIKSNFIYNLLLTISSYAATLIVYPYVARVLGVENMGILGFVNKTIECFMLFSLLGVSVVGVREIAKYKNERSKLDETFSALVSFLILSSLIVSIIYFVIVSVVPRFHESPELFYAGLTRIALSAFFLDWFYQGIENFKYIAIRTVFIRIVYIISVFCVVKEASDYKLYFYITLMTFVLDVCINLLLSRKYVNIKLNFRGAKKFATPLLMYGFYSILNATFSTFNYILLGFLCDNSQVGYYSTADNIYRIYLSVITAFTTVMLPRMSSLLKSDNKEEFYKSLDKSLDGILMVCIPLAIFGVFFAPEIVMIISGPGYEGAIIPLQIMMPLVLINGLNQVFIIQAAIPLGLDRPITIGTTIASIVSLPLNFFMMKNFLAIGSSLMLFFSVVLANIYPIFILFKHGYIELPQKIFISRLLQSIPYLIIAMIGVLLSFWVNNYIVFFMTGFLFAVCFLMINYKLIVIKKKNNSIYKSI